MPPRRSNRLRLLAVLCLQAVVTHADPPPVEPTALDQAEALFGQRRYAEAQPLFEAALTADPTNLQALLHLGKLAIKRSAYDQAVEFFGRAVVQAPDDADTLFELGAASSLYADTLGTSLKALQAARRGRSALERSVELAPANLIHRQALLEFYATAPLIAGGSKHKALAQADAIAKLDADQGAFAHANLQRLDHDLAGAMTTLATVIERAPDNYFALFQFGRCAAESGIALQRGLAALQHCLELTPPEKAAPPAVVWWRIGQIEQQLGRLPAARAAFLEACTLAPHESQFAADLAALPPQDA